MEPEGETVKTDQTLCEATGKPHTTIMQNSELFCLDCRRPIETCCEGAAGSET